MDRMYNGIMEWKQEVREKIFENNAECMNLWPLIETIYYYITDVLSIWHMTVIDYYTVGKSHVFHRLI